MDSLTCAIVLSDKAISSWRVQGDAEAKVDTVARKENIEHVEKRSAVRRSEKLKHVKTGRKIHMVEMNRCSSDRH